MAARGRPTDEVARERIVTAGTEPFILLGPKAPHWLSRFH